MKKYSIYTVPADTQPAAFGKEWLRKVLGYTKSKNTADNYHMKIKGGDRKMFSVFFTLKEAVK